MSATKEKSDHPRRALLNWYEEHKRDLPWRRSRDPYAIWVSEIMLQQTRVETVLPYYGKFLNRFPSLESLARAEVEEVLGVWSGLGYYRRARLLHQAAQRLSADRNQLPRKVKELRDLPGIGAYTAAAIGSIAFGLAEPAIDGNVERVISRYLGIDVDPKRGEARQLVRQSATDLLDEQRPGDSNQALMELGATLCGPRNPQCLPCPLGPDCQGRISGDPGAYPAARPRPAATRVRRQVAIVGSQGTVLLFRRPEAAEILPGMWELPWIEPRDGIGHEERFANRYGGCWQIGDSLGKVRHSITHRQFEVEVFAARLETGEVLAESREAGWFSPQDLGNLPVSSLVRKSLALVATGSTAFSG